MSEKPKVVLKGIILGDSCGCKNLSNCIFCHHCLKCPYCRTPNCKDGWGTYTRKTCYKCERVFLNPRVKEISVQIGSDLPRWKQLDMKRKENQMYFREENKFLNEVLKRDGGNAAH